MNCKEVKRFLETYSYLVSEPHTFIQNWEMISPAGKQDWIITFIKCRMQCQIRQYSGITKRKEISISLSINKLSKNNIETNPLKNHVSYLIFRRDKLYVYKHEFPLKLKQL